MGTLKEFLTDLTMSDINKRPLKVALHGMDSRATKIMAMYFQGPCEGAARLVSDQEDADVDMFDGDVPTSKKIMASYLQEQLSRPAIVLSLQEFVHEGVLHIKKPTNLDDMLRVIAAAKKLARLYSKQTAIKQNVPSPQNGAEEYRQEDMLEFDIDQAKLFSSGEPEDESFNSNNVTERQALGNNIIAFSDYKAMDGRQPSISNTVETQSKSTAPKETVPNKDSSDAAKNPLLASKDQCLQLETSGIDGIEKDWFDEWFESQSTNTEE